MTVGWAEKVDYCLNFKAQEVLQNLKNAAQTTMRFERGVT